MENFEKFIGTILDHHQPKGLRILKSGVIGIARGQTARIHLLNSGKPGSVVKSAWVQGLKANRSEPISQSIFSLESGASAYLDLTGDMIEDDNGERIHIRAVVTVPDDEDELCQATLEVFENETKRTSVLIGMHNNINSQRSVPYNLEQNIERKIQKLIDNSTLPDSKDIRALIKTIKRLIEQVEILGKAVEKKRRKLEKLRRELKKLNEKSHENRGALDDLNPEDPDEFIISLADILLKAMNQRTGRK